MKLGRLRWGFVWRMALMCLVGLPLLVGLEALALSMVPESAGHVAFFVVIMGNAPAAGQIRKVWRRRHPLRSAWGQRWYDMTH